MTQCFDLGDLTVCFIVNSVPLKERMLLGDLGLVMKIKLKKAKDLL